MTHYIKDVETEDTSHMNESVIQHCGWQARNRIYFGDIYRDGRKVRAMDRSGISWEGVKRAEIAQK